MVNLKSIHVYGKREREKNLSRTKTTIYYHCISKEMKLTVFDPARKEKREQTQ